MMLSFSGARQISGNSVMISIFTLVTVAAVCDRRNQKNIDYRRKRAGVTDAGYNRLGIQHGCF